MTVTRWPEHSRQVVNVLPAKGREGERGAGRVAALVLSPGQAPHLDAETVAATLKLMPAQSGVGGALTPAEITFESGRGPSTVRDHVRNMHVKLGPHRQTDPTRLVLSLGSAPASLTRPNNQTQAARSPLEVNVPGRVPLVGRIIGIAAPTRFSARRRCGGFYQGPPQRLLFPQDSRGNPPTSRDAKSGASSLILRWP